MRDREEHRQRSFDSLRMTGEGCWEMRGLRRVRMRVLPRGRIAGLAPLLLGDKRRSARRMEHLQVFDVVIRHRSQRHVHVFETVRIFLNSFVDTSNAPIQNREARELYDRFSPITWIKFPNGLA